MNLPNDKRNLGAYELFQLLTYGNILPVSGIEELENGKQAEEQFTEWMNREAEQQREEQEWKEY